MSILQGRFLHQERDELYMFTYVFLSVKGSQSEASLFNKYP